MRERVKWIDTAKFLGIFAIYLGHFRQSIGNAYTFVFSYHVALFFLLAGCTSVYDNENNLKNYIVKKFKRIMVPFWGFCILSIVLNTIIHDYSLKDINGMLLLVAKGNIRNSFFAGSLWFLSCLFVMEIVFKLLKMLKYKGLVLGICLAMFVIAEKGLEPRPIADPQWIYNIDSMLYYIIFYALGYVAYPYVVELFKADTVFKKLFIVISGSISLMYSIALFCGVDYTLSLLGGIPIVAIFVPILKSLLIIWLNLIVAKLVEGVPLFNEIGRNTLYLCGNEWVIKNLMVCLVGLWGMQINFPTPLYVYLYVMVLLIVGVKIIIPFEKEVVARRRNRL